MTYDRKDSCMEWVEAHKWEDEEWKWWTTREEHRTAQHDGKTYVSTWLVPDEGPFETEAEVDEILWPRAVDRTVEEFLG